ncbi:hypothetical protein BI364_12855 [Acidihalobacter yilgarnensis]|uniref:TonB-dependent receptor n=1 Tax=Acidihalobacter yilgarnensis TaxID=2819280 RepID=A0A1D8IQT9_9GAMM|nr:TonB-dependent receptor [Acidihalobacter yilgarnensis]AOU98734.1 hypothetical protein BI364_12855 [Acidihalobacter yilgarnensis]
MHHRFVFIGSAGLALFSTLQVAQAAGQPPVLIITPTRFEQPASDAVVPTRVITHREIEASGASTVAGVLRFYPGFDTVASGGPGQLTSVFLQGTNSNMVKVLIDGVPVNDSTTGGAPWADMPAADIARIEVVKGPLSTLWGSNAIGGVVNIITRQPAGVGGHLAGAWGGWGTRTGSLGLHAANSHAAAGATVSHEHSAGTPPVQGMSQPAPYSNRTVTAYGDVHAGGAALRMNLWQSRGRGAYASGYPPYSPLGLSSQQYLHQTAALRFALPLTADWRVKGGVLQTRNVLNQDQPETSNPSAYDFAHSTRNQVFAELAYAAGGTRVLMGASHARSHAASLSYGTAYNDYRRTGAGYAEWQQRMGAWRLTTAVRRTDDSQFGGHDTWNLGVGYRLAANTTLDVSTGTGYRAPTFNDLYGYGGNPALKPEVSRSVQADLRTGLGAMGQLHLSAYQQDINELIETVLVNPTSYQYQNRNVQQARIRGVTAGWSWLRDGLSLALDATWQDPLNLSTGQRLLRRASHSYRARLAYDAGRWQLGSDWIYTGRRDDFSGQTLNPYVLGNLALTVRIDPAWVVRASVDNLLNTYYVPAYYGTGIAYLAPTRSAKVGVRYNFGTF